jgi:hypothetical protein
MFDPRTIPIPERMKHLGTDHRGYALFYVALRTDDGKVNFIVNDVKKTFACAKQNLCSLCGQELERARWFVGGPLSALAKEGAYFDPPMHFDCMRYALAVCPWLTMANYRRKQTIEQIAEKVHQAVVDHTQIPERPPLFVAGMTADHDVYLYGEDHTAFRFVPHRPFLNMEYWQNGRRLNARKGKAIAERALDEFRKSQGTQ